MLTPHRKNVYCCESKPWSWTDIMVQRKQQKRDIRFGTWNIKSLYRAGSLIAAARKWDVGVWTG
jgi:hypothetical protein